MNNYSILIELDPNSAQKNFQVNLRHVSIGKQLARFKQGAEISLRWVQKFAVDLRPFAIATL